ncbi:hypothetical protein NPIL_88881 [Nephila pilipes]|uniref:Uncharacterized protein n=1 Tax=Nephila pilipes TaxID=299642 RepID=A0A8X6N514_NEPPI|nr:hypothetical protein NPIL_88881 [Nephila pilipes]
MSFLSTVRKVDLITLAEELGLTVEPNAKVSDLLILLSAENPKLKGDSNQMLSKHALDLLRALSPHGGVSIDFGNIIGNEACSYPPGAQCCEDYSYDSRSDLCRFEFEISSK